MSCYPYMMQHIHGEYMEKTDWKIENGGGGGGAGRGRSDGDGSEGGVSGVCGCSGASGDSGGISVQYIILF